MPTEGIFPEAIERIKQERAEFFNQYEEKLEKAMEIEQLVGYQPSPFQGLSAIPMWSSIPKKRTKRWAQKKWGGYIYAMKSQTQQTYIGQSLLALYEPEQPKQKNYIWPSLLEMQPEIFTTLDPVSSKIVNEVHLQKLCEHMEYQKNKKNREIPFFKN